MASELTRFAQEIRDRGWAVTGRIADDRTVATLRQVVAPLAQQGRGGARNLLDTPAIASLAASLPLRALATSVLGPHCFAVRALYFDKTPDTNWRVVWHQDLTVATRARVELPGYGPWTDKAGVPHVQPPVDILEHMLAVRLHLDPCTADNGPVRVLDGTHVLGRLGPDTVDRLRAQQAETVCLADEGAVLAFRPLLLHASSPATRPAHRRVIHLEYAARDLTAPLEWYSRVT